MALCVAMGGITVAAFRHGQGGIVGLMAWHQRVRSYHFGHGFTHMNTTSAKALLSGNCTAICQNIIPSMPPNKVFAATMPKGHHRSSHAPSTLHMPTMSQPPKELAITMSNGHCRTAQTATSAAGMPRGHCTTVMSCSRCPCTGRLRPRHSGVCHHHAGRHRPEILDRRRRAMGARVHAVRATVCGRRVAGAWPLAA